MPKFQLRRILKDGSDHPNKEVHCLSPGKTPLGRAQLEDRARAGYVSKNHCAITIYRDGCVNLEDFSNKGTFVRGRKLHQATIEIRPNDTIALGKDVGDSENYYLFRFEEQVPVLQGFQISELEPRIGDTPPIMAAECDPDDVERKLFLLHSATLPSDEVIVIDSDSDTEEDLKTRKVKRAVTPTFDIKLETPEIIDLTEDDAPKLHLKDYLTPGMLEFITNTTAEQRARMESSSDDPGRVLKKAPGPKPMKERSFEARNAPKAQQIKINLNVNLINDAPKKEFTKVDKMPEINLDTPMVAIPNGSYSPPTSTTPDTYPTQRRARSKSRDKSQEPSTSSADDVTGPTIYETVKLRKRSCSQATRYAIYNSEDDDDDETTNRKVREEVESNRAPIKTRRSTIAVGTTNSAGKSYVVESHPGTSMRMTIRRGSLSAPIAQGRPELPPKVPNVAFISPAAVPPTGKKPVSRIDAFAKRVVKRRSSYAPPPTKRNKLQHTQEIRKPGDWKNVAPPTIIARCSYGR